MNRRQFIASASVAAALVTSLRGAGAKRPPRILLRSSWQSVNIGDIGHTPGALSLFDKYFPEAEITLWPRSLGHGARELMTKNFPRLKIAEGNVGKDGKPTSPALAKAWDERIFTSAGPVRAFPPVTRRRRFADRRANPWACSQ